MADEETVHKGACRCGTIQFEVRGAHVCTLACHCTGCQKMTASAYSLNAFHPRDRFAVTQGEAIVGGMKGVTRHMFCPECLSWVFSFPGGLSDIVVVRSMMLDNAASYRPFAEFHTREKLPWAETGAERSFETIPDREEMPVLFAEFAARQG